MTLATHSAASNPFDAFTVPPRSPPARAGTRNAAAPDTATPLPPERRRRRVAGRCDGSTVPQRGPKLRHEPVSVSSIDRPDELHHLPLVACACPLEEEGRRVHGHAEDRGLLVVGHSRFDGLRPGGNGDVVPPRQQVV